MFVDNSYVSPDTWYDEHGKAFQPQIHYFVGGATKLYGAALYRLRPEDFGELRHHDGVSPAWPISYDELEPYYTKAEQVYEVHGNRGEDPTEGRASAPYPFPAVSHEPRIQQLSDALETHGYHPFHAPCGIRLDEADAGVQRAACAARTATASRASCTASPTRTCSASARRSSTPNVTLLTNAHAVEARDERGRHRGHGGRRRARRRRGAVRRRRRRRSRAAPRTPRSCSSSRRTTRHPNGLANGSDQVGRNYMFHNSQAVLALSREENPTTYQKTLGLNDFYFAQRRRGVPAREHPDGRQVAGADVPRREADRDEARSGLVARARREARDRLLALDRGPAAARRTASPSTATARSRSPTRRRTTCRRTSSTRSSSRCSACST